MKKVFIILIMVIPSFCNGQSLGNVWELGLSYNTPNYIYMSAVRFDSGFADTFSVYRSMSMFATNASICDTSGNLLFYSNGQWIANRNNDSLSNGKGFNRGYSTDYYYGDNGLGFVQGMIIIPHPDSFFLYDLFYITTEPLIYQKQQLFYPMHLSHSVVDMRKDHGLGAVTVKNEYIIEDTLLQGKLSACKAANGRDWWILAHKWNSNKFYRWLLTPTTIEGPYEQEIGSTFFQDFGFGQTCFSPDGNQFVFQCGTNILWTIIISIVALDY
ncbi:MAG: hypothetical protein H0W62_02180 [Chitinophagales bacterium]|nr:hypothetical protein [Chitinophagales bacterium]